MIYCWLCSKITVNTYVLYRCIQFHFHMLVTYIQYNEKDKILGIFNDEPRKGYYPLLISLKFPSERRRVTGSYRRQTDKMWTVQNRVQLHLNSIKCHIYCILYKQCRYSRFCVVSLHENKVLDDFCVCAAMNI